MPNAKYISGRTFEYKVKSFLEGQGYFVVRSAGSHSPVDLVAVDSLGQVLFVQCKLKGAMTKKEQKDFAGFTNKYNCTPIFAYKVGRTMELEKL